MKARFFLDWLFVHVRSGHLARQLDQAHRELAEARRAALINALHAETTENFLAVLGIDHLPCLTGDLR